MVRLIIFARLRIFEGEGIHKLLAFEDITDYAIEYGIVNKFNVHFSYA